MRTLSLLFCCAVALAALALWPAPEAEAAPLGASAVPVVTDVYVGFGYGGRCGPRYRRTYCGPRYYRRTYVRPVYHYAYYPRPYYRSYYRPYYYTYPRFSIGFGLHHHGYPRYAYGHHHRHYRHHGHYRGPRRTVGRRR